MTNDGLFIQEIFYSIDEDVDDVVAYESHPYEEK
jgi:hypothetical protein